CVEESRITQYVRARAWPIASYDGGQGISPTLPCVGPPGPAPRVATVQRLEPEHGILGDALTCVPTKHLPRRAPVDCNLLQDTVACSTPSSGTLGHDRAVRRGTKVGVAPRWSTAS